MSGPSISMLRGVTPISTRSDPNLEGFALRTSPVWWICSAQYIHSPSEPLPLILVDEPSIYRRYALEALERANIPWRQAYLASNLIGIKAATRAGLACVQSGLPY